jgi:endonuclease/exonuclease/phosphatase family metal-dependent hydrolase
MKPLLSVALTCALAGTALGADTLRVMAYNVRQPAKGDGPNLWELRRDIFINSIRAAAPDLIGTQELFQLQGEYIAEKLPQYDWFSLGRRGDRTDEHMGVFFNRDKFLLHDSGHFWLSETPEVPGSIAWDMSLPRMVTWGLFEIKDRGTRFYFYNTHFAHRRQDEEARVRSAEVILRRIEALPADVPIILAGDFNTPPGGEVHRMFTRVFQDAWLTAAHRVGPEATFHGFRGGTEGNRIDWILYRTRWKVLEAATLTYNEDGRYPSDHYPVLAVFDLGAK